MAELICSDCGQRCATTRGLGIHRSAAHGRGRRELHRDVALRSCDLCGKTWNTSQRGLSNHTRYCDPNAKPGDKPAVVACPDCGKAFGNARAMNVHWAKIHEHPKSRVEPDSFDAQILRDRGPANPLRCPWSGCGHVASDVAARNRHVLEDCPRRPAEKATVTAA